MSIHVRLFLSLAVWKTLNPLIIPALKVYLLSRRQTCQPVRILRSGHAFWPQSTQVRFVTLNYAKSWWRLCARTVAYLNQATAMKEDFDQSERWVHSPSSKWDDWQMRRPIIKKRLQIDSKTKSRSVSYLFTPAVWFLKRGQYTRYLQLM